MSQFNPNIPLDINTCISLVNAPIGSTIQISSEGTILFNSTNTQPLTLKISTGKSTQMLMVPANKSFQLTLNPFTQVVYNVSAGTWCVANANTPVSTLITSKESRTAIESAVIIGVITAATLAIVLGIWHWITSRVSHTKPNTTNQSLKPPHY